VPAQPPWPRREKVRRNTVVYILSDEREEEQIEINLTEGLRCKSASILAGNRWGVKFLSPSFFLS
jgi:hypothetical protein